MQINISAPLLAAVMSGSLAFAASGAYASDDYKQRGAAATERAQFDQRQHAQAHQARELGREDRKVAKRVMEANAGTIELAQIAERRAGDQEIQEFARELRSQARESNRDFAGISRELRTERVRPTELDRWAIERLRAIESDREFDQAFSELMVARKQMAIEGLELVAQDTRYNRQLRQAAQEQLGQTRQQLQLAQELERDVRLVAGADQFD